MLDEGPSAEWKLQNINRIMTTYNLTRDDLGDWAADLPDEYRSADEYIADQLLRHDDPRIRESYMRYADPDTIRERVRERAEQRIQNESPFQTELAAFTDGQPDVLDLFNLSWVDDDNALEQRLNS